MFFKIFNKIKNKICYLQAISLFKKTNSNINSLRLGGEVNCNYYISYPENLTIGGGTVVRGNLFINAYGSVTIGQYCHIAQGLTIYSHNHNYKSTKKIPYDEINIKKPVEIGDAVWIGANVTIAPGSKIGNGVIISSGSVVFGEIEECAIVRGNPAKVIGYRNKDVFYNLYNKGEFF
jgi:acetyltransferase-like isoleucine patch superfamily enzyme